MARDPLIESAHAAEAEAPDAATQQRFADLFDVRRIIGALFAVYGLILVLLGLFASDADVERAQGINANLRVGLSLLLVAAVLFVWALRWPLGAELVEGDEGESPR